MSLINSFRFFPLQEAILIQQYQPFLHNGYYQNLRQIFELVVISLQGTEIADKLKCNCNFQIARQQARIDRVKRLWEICHGELTSFHSSEDVISAGTNS